MTKRRICYIIAVLTVVIGIFFVGSSFSRYASKSVGNMKMNVAAWKVNLKEGGESLEKNFDVVFTLTSSSNPNVGSNKFAPGSTANAALVLDLSGTEVAVDYSITVGSPQSQIGLCDITLTVADDGNNAVPLGKDIYIALPDGQKFTDENGVIRFNFNLTWNADSNNAADTYFACTQDVLILPVYVKVKQHGDNADREEENKKADADISYIESTETKQRATPPLSYTFDEQDLLSDNPERGFYSASSIGLNENGIVLPPALSSAVTKSNVGNMLYLKVDLSAFSGNMNGARDKDLTSAAIAALDGVLSQIKQNNNTAIVRFVYDNNATGIIADKPKVEPAQATILKHIEQLSPVFKKYSTVINVVQIGFYGLWGECFYNTDATEHPEYYKQTVTALLNATRNTDITVAVRTPQYYSWYKETDIKNIDKDITTVADDAYRVGIFNDAYGASADDLGTYKDRKKETDWLKNQASHTFYGGEAITDVLSPGAVNGVGPYNDPSYFIEEAFKIHAAYLNWEWNQNIHKQWASRTYTGSDSIYKNKSALAYIENHLGYRFVLKNARTYEFAASKGRLPVDITVNNVGFGNIIKSKRADIILTNADGRVIKTYSGVAVNAKKFLSRTTVKQSVTIDLPQLLGGEYRIYLRLSSGEILDNGQYYSAIRFANKDVYNPDLQANFVGKFTVK